MAGTGVNIDLFNAVQSNNESEVHAFIDAGGDVNITDDEGKTALFYAVQQSDNESVVRALMEKGNCFSNPRDSYGRTPIFYAIDKSLSLIHYLLQKKANVHIKDNCNMSLLSFFIEHCVTSPQDLNASYVTERIDLLLQNRVKKNTVFETIMSVVFSKCPLLFHSGINVRTMNLILQFAKAYITEERELKETKIDDILEALGKIVDDKQLCEDRMLKILYLLFELGADPNSSDSKGNTALHYTTCLPFYGVSQEAVMDILRTLEEVGVTFNAKNHQNETPLLFCLSLHNDSHPDESSQCSVIKAFVEVCGYLLEKGSNIEDTTRKGDSVFHLVLRFQQRLLKWHTNPRFDEVLEEGIKVLDLISERVVKQKSTVIKIRDANDNSPLDYGASLEYFHEKGVAHERNVFSDFMKKILDNLLRCGAKLHEQNKSGEIPIHRCKTWTAIRLMLEQNLEAGAKPKDVDSFGCSPLLTAAKNNFPKNQEACFYPDVEHEPKAFWETVLEEGLDPWVVDKHGESVCLYVLMESQALDLAKSLIDAFCINHFKLQQPKTIANAILITICKDKSSACWKKEYVEKVLKKIQMPICTMKSKISPLRLCCEKIIEASKDLPERAKTSVYWDIVKLLLSYQADCNTPDATGQSCMDIADACPYLKDLLTTDFEIHNFTKWRVGRCIAKRHEKKLMEVSRFTQHCVVQLDEQLWYHKECIGKGSFGCEVFVGINVKDGRELAIKRVKKDQKTNEAQILVKLGDSQHIIRYFDIRYYPCKYEFLFLLFELMEGDISQYLKADFSIPIEERINLCKQLLNGVHHMHGKDIIHRHLKPTNILILRSGDERRLKISGFGQSCEVDKQPLPAQYEDGKDSKCWIAPEVLNGELHSKKSDMFSCGLVLHRIRLNTHPYGKVNAKQKDPYNNIVSNIRNGKRDEWDKSLSPEMVHMLENVLVKDKENRSTAQELLSYPVFWTKDKKIKVLSELSDEIKLERSKRERSERERSERERSERERSERERSERERSERERSELEMSKRERSERERSERERSERERSERERSQRFKPLEKRFEAIVNMNTRGQRETPKNKLTWDMAMYGRNKMGKILDEMYKSGKKRDIPGTYNERTLEGLLRLIRNAHRHVIDIEDEEIKNLVRNYVFLTYFPNLVVEVFKLIKDLKWDETKPEIQKAVTKADS